MQVRRIELTVQDPEVIVASKLTGQKVRPQDRLDIAAVLDCGTPIDDARLRTLVGHRPERFEVYEAIRRGDEET